MNHINAQSSLCRACGIVALCLMSFGVALAQDDSERTGPVRDAWLDGKLESALLFNPHLNSFDIHTDVRAGTAYLSGFVESEVDSELAAAIAESINGISSVENDLEVEPREAMAARGSDDPVHSERRTLKTAVDDLTLTARVKTRLLANDSTAGMAIDVDTIDGVVTLTGVVGSLQEKALAGRLARNVPGAAEVENFLVVEDS